jgi:hypothetical protein
MAGRFTLFFWHAAAGFSMLAHFTHLDFSMPIP